jgi:hypothetical protein
MGPGQSPMVSFCEHGNNLAVPKESRQFFDKLSDCRLFKECPVHGVS